MNFNQFLRKTFPDLSVKKRTHLGKFHNFVKFLAIRFGFILYKLKISANLLDVIALVLSIFGFYFLYLSALGYKLVPTLGVLIIFFHVWVDFIDGLLAKARNEENTIGHHFDNLGCDVDRFMLIVLLGIFTHNHFLVINNVFVSYILVIFHSQTKGEIFRLNRLNRLKFIYSHKLSLLGVRFMLGILPMLILLFVWTNTTLRILGLIFTSIYTIYSLIWLIICIPKINDLDINNGVNH